MSFDECMYACLLYLYIGAEILGCRVWYATLIDADKPFAKEIVPADIL